MENEIVFKTKILGRLFSKLTSQVILGVAIFTFSTLLMTEVFYSFLVRVMSEDFLIILRAILAFIFLFIGLFATIQRNKKNFIGTLVLTETEILAQSKQMDTIRKILEKGNKIRISYTGYNQEKVQGERETGQQNWLYFDPTDKTKKVEFYIDTNKHRDVLVSVLKAWYERGVEIEETKGGVKSYLLEVPKKSMLSVFKKKKDK